MMSSNFSRDFFDLVKAIGECRSKQEEDRIIESEMSSLKAKFLDVSILRNPKNMKEFLVRSIYVEMLGHDASGFAYIHGVNMSHHKDLAVKRVGYLVSCLFLDPNSSELMILLINTIHKDLKSSNLLEISFALIAVSRLANAEMVPALLSQVTVLLEHQNEMIRRRAVAAFHRLVQIGGEVSAQQIHLATRKSLCDSDPGVMAVGLNLLQDLVLSDPSVCLDLVPSLVAILKQVIEHRLPKDFEYHRMPAPWIQMRLVSILSTLGKNNDTSSEQIYDVLQETMRRADVGSNVGAALAAECIKCAVSIVPSHTLLEFSSHMVSKFIASENNNLKYLGITSLALLARINVSYAAEHQILVVECLEDSDETLRRKTIDLLSEMTNSANVCVVVDKLLSQLEEKLEDSHFRSDLVEKICSLAERFAPSNEWYLVTINQAFVLAGSETSVPDSIGENLTRLVAEQDGPDDISGNDLREVAANEYVTWLEKFVASSVKLSDAFLRLAVWMVGEFAPLCSLEGYNQGVDDVIDLLVDSAGKTESESLISSIITAASKLAVLTGDSSILRFLKNLKSKFPLSSEIHRRCCETQFVLRQPKEIQQRVLPFDSACEELDIDLSFLDPYCESARKRGAKEYEKPPKFFAGPVEDNTSSSSLKSLRFEPYLPPPPVVQKPAIISPPLSIPSSPLAARNEPLTRSSAIPSTSGTLQLNVASGARRWGPPQSEAPAVSAAPQKLPVKDIKVEPKVTTDFEKEKQRRAEALFSGVLVNGSSPALRYARGKPKGAMKVQADLLDIDGPPARTQPDADLLDL